MKGVITWQLTQADEACGSLEATEAKVGSLQSSLKGADPAKVKPLDDVRSTIKELKR